MLCVSPSVILYLTKIHTHTHTHNTKEITLKFCALVVGVLANRLDLFAVQVYYLHLGDSTCLG